MRLTLLLALALCGASGAHAADPLTPDESLAAYCVGAAQVRVLAYEFMIASPCGPDVAQCTVLRQTAGAALPSLRHELKTALSALSAHGLLDDGRRPETHRASNVRQVGEAMAVGEREGLVCLNMRLPGSADPGTGDIGQTCQRVAACAVRPSS